MPNVPKLHDAVKRGDLVSIKALLGADRGLANARSKTDTRGTYPLHVAAEHGQAAAARMLVDHGADVTLLDKENNATALCWAAFFGRPAVVTVLLEAGSELNPRNKHGLTPLGCAIGGTRGQWQSFSNATLDDWRKAVDAILSAGGVE